MVDFRMRRVEGGVRRSGEQCGEGSLKTSANMYVNEPAHLSSGSVILVTNSIRWICD